MARRILLVDDDPTVRLTLKAVLELNGFSVVTAASASEAHQKLSAGIYELVITDARMESEDSGLRVIETARQQVYRPATALLTAFPPDSRGWKETESDSVLVKPIGTQELLAQLEDVLTRHQQKLAADSSQGGASTISSAKLPTAPRINSRAELSPGAHRKVG